MTVNLDKSIRSENIRKYLPPTVVLLITVVFYALCINRVQTVFPELRPQDGVLDAREADFSGNVYHLVNTWDYYPGHLYAPDSFDGSAPAPEADNDSPLDPNKGTWRLRILAQPDTYLSLCSFSVDYSTRVFVNGKEVRSVGFVSDDPAEAVPMVRYMTLPLYSGDSGEIEILYQYANFVHHDGGFIQKTLISTPENVDEYQRGLTLNAIVICGGLMMLCFYFLLCASFQKNREYAALALCCVVIALRNHFFFAEHLLSFASDFYSEYRLIVLDVSWIPMTAVFLFAAYFPQSAEKITMACFSGLCLVLSALHFIVDTHDLVLLCHICYYICLPFALWLFVRQFLAFRKKKPDASDIVTLTAILFFVAMLIREGTATGSDSSVNHFGITPLAVLVCILGLAAVNNGKISGQMVQLKEERQRNELLLQMNATNNDFLRTVAHELKTPLTVISGYTQLIERQIERNQLSDKTPERLRTVHSEADRLAEMVTKLMDYTYGHAHEAEMTGVGIETLFRSTSDVMAPVCAKRKNILEFRSNGASSVRGNEELLLQVLINLIINASRHTEEGVITVEAADKGGFVEFSVSDTGDGIAPDVVPHIFEKGYSTDDGRGLGLSICMDTVKLHGGTLVLSSTGPEGTVFRFTVPKEESR